MYLLRFDGESRESFEYLVDGMFPWSTEFKVAGISS